MDENETLMLLDGCRFPAAAVMRAAGIDQNTLTNYLSKSSLELCSESPGQGRARHYCLVDVYQIALLSKLSRLSGSVAWSAGALNMLLFLEADLKLFAKELIAKATSRRDHEHAAYRREVCDRLAAAPEAYSWRDATEPYFLYARLENINLNLPSVKCLRRSDFGFMGMSFLGGIVWNMTWSLLEVDNRLIDYIDSEPSR